MRRAAQPGLFGPPPPAPTVSDPLCAYCNMPKSKHCPGNIEHVDEHKSRVRKITCHTRHCLVPLCCCVDFVEPEGSHAPVKG